MRWPEDGFEPLVDGLLYDSPEHMGNVARRARYWSRRRDLRRAVYRVETWRRPSLFWRLTHAARGILRGA